MSLTIWYCNFLELHGAYNTQLCLATIFSSNSSRVAPCKEFVQDATAIPLFWTMKILTVPGMVCFEAALYARDLGGVLQARKQTMRVLNNHSIV